eukprot:Nk52_evm45s1129 gene=Nk52_evmTU45s1129
MDPDTRSKLIEALKKVHSPRLGQAERREIQGYLDAFKADPLQCLTCSLNMCSYVKEGEDMLFAERFFFLGCVKDVIKGHWGNLSTQQKEETKHSVLTLMSRGTADIVTERKFIKEKLSQLVVEIAKREWPQHWPGMIDSLFQIAGLGEVQLELVLLVFLSLNEDIERFNDELDNKRKIDLHSGLLVIVDQLLSFLISQLESRVEQLKQFAPDNPACKVNYSLCETILRVFAVFLEWIPFRESYESLPGFFCYLAQVPRLRLHACECISVIAQRKPKFDDRFVMLAMFREMFNLKSTLDMCVHGGLKFSDEDTHAFVKAICKSLSLFGANHLPFLFSKLNSFPPGTDTYIMLMLVFYGHHSVIVSSFTLNTWISIFRNEELSKSSLVQSFLPVIIANTLDRAVRNGDPSWTGSEASIYSKQDFDDWDDYNDFIATLRNKLFDLIGLLILASPGECVHTACQKAKEAVLSPFMARITSSGGSVDPRSSVGVQIEGCFYGVDSVVNNLGKLFKSNGSFLKSYKESPLNSELMGFFDFLIAFESDDPVLLHMVVASFSSLHVYLSFIETDITRLVGKLTQLVKFIPEKEKSMFAEKGVLSSDTLVLRRKSQALFNKLCGTQASRMVGSLPELTNYVMELFNSGQLGHSDMPAVLDSLVSVSNGYATGEQQQEYVDSLLNRFCSPILDLLSTISSPEGFVQFLGINRQVDTSTSSMVPFCRDLDMKSRRVLLAVAHTLAVCIKTCKLKTASGQHPCKNIIGKFLPVILNMIKTIHFLWTAQGRSMVSKSFQCLFEPGRDYVENLLGTKVARTSERDFVYSINLDVTFADYAERLQSFNDALREQCYDVVADCARLNTGFFDVPNVMDILCDSIFFCIDDVELRHLRSLLRICLRNFNWHCPKEKFEEFLLPLTLNFVSHLLKVLEKEWGSLGAENALDYDSFSGGIAAEDMHDTELKEIVRDKILRGISNDLIEFISTGMFQKLGKLGVKDGGVSDLSEFGNFLVERSPDYLNIAFVVCVNCLGLPDSTVCKKSVNTGVRLLPIMLKRGMCTPENVNALLNASFAGLKNHGEHEEMKSDCLLLINQVYTLVGTVDPNLVPATFIRLLGISPSVMQEFDEAIKSEKSMKRKRDLFSRLLGNIVGKNIGQQGKNPVSLLSIPDKLFITKQTVKTEHGDDSQFPLWTLFEEED